MSAQVTEAHIALSARITRENGYDPESAWNRPHVLRDAQYIADSEAKATAELRAVFPKILQALGNGACCAPDVSLDFLQSIPNEVAGVVEKLRAGLEQASITRDATCIALSGELREARAERAEAKIADERAKVRTLREACESIEEQWDKNHSANPFHAGNVMQSHAMRALAATEDAQ